jgi:hypothetical protein
VYTAVATRYLALLALAPRIVARRAEVVITDACDIYLHLITVQTLEHQNWFLIDSVLQDPFELVIDVLKPVLEEVV